MPVIITLIIAMFLILISWTWHNLSGIDKTKKILTIVISLIVVFIITFIQFNISKEGWKNKHLNSKKENIYTIINVSEVIKENIEAILISK